MDAAEVRDAGEVIGDSGTRDAGSVAPDANFDAGPDDAHVRDAGRPAVVTVEGPVDMASPCADVCASMTFGCDDQYEWLFGVGGSNLEYGACGFVDSCAAEPASDFFCGTATAALSRQRCACVPP